MCVCVREAPRRRRCRADALGPGAAGLTEEVCRSALPGVCTGLGVREEIAQGRPQQRLGRRLEEVAKAVGGGYCRLQMPVRLALGVRGTVAGHRLGALEGGGGTPPFQSIAGGAGGAADNDEGCREGLSGATTLD